MQCLSFSLCSYEEGDIRSHVIRSVCYFSFQEFPWVLAGMEYSLDKYCSGQHLVHYNVRELRQLDPPVAFGNFAVVLRALLKFTECVIDF